MIHAVNLPDGSLRLVRETGETVLLTPQEVRLVRAQAPVHGYTASHLDYHNALSVDAMRNAGML